MRSRPFHISTPTDEGKPRDAAQPEPPRAATPGLPPPPVSTRLFIDHWPYQEVELTDFHAFPEPVRSCYGERDLVQIERRRLWFAPIPTASLAAVSHTSGYRAAGGFGGPIELLHNPRQGQPSGGYRRMPYREQR